jgi:hypothetical protein
MRRSTVLAASVIAGCVWALPAAHRAAAQAFIGLPPAPGEVGDIRRGRDGRIEPVHPIERGTEQRRAPARRPQPAPAGTPPSPTPQAAPAPARAPEPAPAPPPRAAEPAPTAPAAAPAAAAAPVEPEAGPELLPGWIADTRTGCRVWNADPRPAESVTWSGDCVDGLATGRGTAQWFTNGRPTDRYEGEYRAGQENGSGTFAWANGERYEGEWRNGERAGRGVYVWPNGDRYEGEWRDGLRAGRGVYAWRTGDRYEGEWLDDAPTGVGTYAGPGRRAAHPADAQSASDPSRSPTARSVR